MTELVYLCGRDGTVGTYSSGDLDTIADRILPENAPQQAEVVRDDGVMYCLINPSESVMTETKSVCLGQMIPLREDWHEPDSPPPDGSYGLVRANETTVELLSDMTASRTLYYYHEEGEFIVSTSQRAVLHLLDSFVPEETAIAWMVSSGSLGPHRSWDERIKALPPDTRLQLDRSSWELTETSGPAWEPFDPVDQPKNAHKARLEEALDRTFCGLDLDIPQWALPLSGGLDSRELLLRLQDEPGLRTITWGTSAALEEPDSDAVRAQQLATTCDVPHQYYTLPQEVDDLETIFERFLTAGEGRIDHFQGYTDGFGIFESIAKDGTEGIIRGDEGFGWLPVKSSTGVRNVVGAEMVTDFRSLPSLSIPGTNAQRLPDRYQRNSNESLEMWRDRLYHTYRLPVILSALTSLKTPYVEVVNPFLTREILRTVRTFPDEMRTDKQLYTEYVMDRSPPVPVANRSPDPDIGTILGTAMAREYLRGELDTEHARGILGDEVVEYALEGITRRPDSEEETESNRRALDTVKRTVGTLFPASINQLIVEHTPVERVGETLPETRLAFRLYVIHSMFERFEEDVQVL